MGSSLAIVLMSKYPIPGKVKTRLFPRCSPEQAARFHELFLVHTAKRLSAIELGDFYVCYDPIESREDFARLIDGADATLIPQGSGDLGQRLIRAAGELLKRHERVAFFGADSPDLPIHLIRHALSESLRQDVVVGPTEDGGYWTITLSRNVDLHRLFDGIPWSSGQECSATLERAAAQHLDLEVVGQWSDVDHPTDMDALAWRLEHSQHPDDLRLWAQLEPMLCDWSQPAHA